MQSVPKCSADPSATLRSLRTLSREDTKAFLSRMSVQARLPASGRVLLVCLPGRITEVSRKTSPESGRPVFQVADFEMQPCR